MLSIKNNSDTMIILVHEICGINQFIKETCEYFSMCGYDVFCPDLLNTCQPFDYNQENVAYQYVTPKCPVLLLLASEEK